MVVSLLKAPLLTDHQTRADFPKPYCRARSSRE